MTVRVVCRLLSLTAHRLSHVYTLCQCQWRSSGVVKVHGAECRGPQFQAKNKSNLTDLQILGCELHKTEFGGRGPATALSQTP